MKNKFSQIIKYILNYSILFFPIFLAIEEIFLSIIFQHLTNLSIINSNKFAQEFGIPTYVYIWIILPLTIAVFATHLKNYFLKNKKKVFISKTNIIIALISISFLTISGVYCYNDSHKAKLTIFSVKSIHNVIIQSLNSDKEIKFENLNDNANEYILAKRIPYGSYKITILYKNGKKDIKIRTFNTRSKRIMIFE